MEVGFPGLLPAVEDGVGAVFGGSVVFGDLLFEASGSIPSFSASSRMVSASTGSSASAPGPVSALSGLRRVVPAPTRSRPDWSVIAKHGWLTYW